jgi:hypothetical protein
MTKQLRYITRAFLTLLLLHSCQEEIALDESNQISFTTSVQDQTSISRATIFENQDDILNYAEDGKGGGNLTMHAYVSNTGTERFKSRAWYFNNVWRFYDASSNKFYNHYWPNYSMDFFAYMPWDGSGRLKNIEVGNHVAGKGLTINCTMQDTTADNNNETDDLLDPLGQETIIAYTPNKHKKKVELNFVHPFAAVSFELKQAHRNLTINWIRFNNVYLTGTTTLKYATNNSTQISWTGTGSTSSFTIPVGKTIPTDINFGAKIGGPYLVMPQSFGKGTYSEEDDITITINYTWDDDGNNIFEADDTKDLVSSITVNGVDKWESGKKYNYVLDLGDNKEEILFKVLVEPWDVTGDGNNIFDVE